MAVYVFGSNIMGQCGLPEDHCNSATPTTLPINGDRVACGYLHAVLLEGGSVVTWGVNDEGALGREGDEQPGIVEIGEKVTEISAGGSVSAAITISGELYVWGTFRNSHGVFGLTAECEISHRPLRILGNVLKVSCGKNFVAALTRKNGLVTFGVGENNELGYRSSARLKRCLVPRQISNRYKKNEKFIDVFSGNRYGMAINKEKRLFSWEGGVLRSCRDNAKDVAIGSDHVHVITEDGMVYAKGGNLDGQLGLGHKSSTAEQENEWNKLSLENVVKIRTKMDFSLAQVNNEIYSWGPSTFGETGFETDCPSPRKIPFDFGEIVDFSVGSDFSVVIGK